MATVSIAGQEVVIERSKLRKWVQLSEIRESIGEAVEKKNFMGVADLLVQYVSTASSVDCQDVPWFEVSSAFVEIQNTNVSTKPIPMTDTVLRESDPIPWDYKGRLWYMWANMFAAKYHWGLEYIAELDVDDALALIQEMMVEDHLQREWEWSLSEVAYEYVKSSGVSRLRQYPRPDWMLPKHKDIAPKKTVLRTSFLPVGNIQNLSGMELHGRIDASLN